MEKTSINLRQQTDVSVTMPLGLLVWCPTMMEKSQRVCVCIYGLGAWGISVSLLLSITQVVVSSCHHSSVRVVNEGPIVVLQVSTAVPERKVVFKGQTSDGVDSSGFEIKPRIVYPMEGGTALITFEEDTG